ncbi:MerR family transcriptional regulator [Pandoraea cepalis]|uniref:MerR family transcriptional regulator n=1 Tax=Pandoraea cepalis TaxID=2508294 RepID=A0A5E4SHU2_9BURK|nr:MULTISPECIES: MerR family transcriptional regulator [Pandoraea]MBN8959481.1 MerR family transcriptional regulator [Hyphomicrobiales bacterium]OJY17680.1 MAG: MerR family transcriptional regulator [Pandoraea sp. 64-18]BDD91204.1 MerR family transcriptional regulator [Pandoraea sp. NE5]VVD73599.1 MerR family transcriptional regulator [Pandoraea cepalis]
MRIGELARRTGVSERMLRYYENEGLLNPRRTDSGYREYGSDEVDAAQRIRTLSAAGLKISSIRLLLPCVLGEKPVFHPCVEARALLRGEVEKLDVRLRELSETREVVARLLNAVDTNETLAL